MYWLPALQHATTMFYHGHGFGDAKHHWYHPGKTSNQTRTHCAAWLGVTEWDLIFLFFFFFYIDPPCPCPCLSAACSFSMDILFSSVMSLPSSVFSTLDLIMFCTMLYPSPDPADVGAGFGITFLSAFMKDSSYDSSLPTAALEVG